MRAQIQIGTIIKFLAAALLALGLVAFVACGGSSDGDGAASGGVEEHTEGDTHAADEHMEMNSVHVSLSEWSISPAHGAAFEAAAGDVVFEIHNEGTAPHDLVIVKTDLAPDALPISDGVVDVEAAGEVVGGVDPFPGGEIMVEDYNLEAGSYVLVCSIPGHYQQGMFAQLTVK